MKGEKSFKAIFPNGDVKNFLRYYEYWRKNKFNKLESLDMALWSYGEVRQSEYIREKGELLEVLK